MHSGFVAVQAPVDRLLMQFSVLWPHYEIVRTAKLPSMDGYLAWKKDNERFVAADAWTLENPGFDVFGLLQDGPWAVLLDSTYVLASDEDALASLSEACGTCLSFVTETAGGCASFVSFGQGQLVRRIESVDGQVTTAGDPLPQEAGFDPSRYYLEQAEELQKRLGLSFLRDSALTEVLAIATVDRTDYTGLVTARSAEPRAIAPTRKPWWRLW